jgi:hypothetical protein
MGESKIGWRRLENENAWVGVRGRFKFFTLRVTHPTLLTDDEAELDSQPFLLTYHMDSARPENLKPMTLSEAQAHAEHELDNWLYKAGLIEGEPLTPTRHAVNSALSIVEACQADGLRGLVSEYERERFAERIALYSTLSTLTELATIAQKAQDSEGHVADVLEQHREQLYEVMKSLKELI